MIIGATEVIGAMEAIEFYKLAHSRFPGQLVGHVVAPSVENDEWTGVPCVATKFVKEDDRYMVFKLSEFEADHALDGVRIKTEKLKDMGIYRRELLSPFLMTHDRDMAFTPSTVDGSPTVSTTLGYPAKSLRAKLATLRSVLRENIKENAISSQWEDRVCDMVEAHYETVMRCDCDSVGRCFAAAVIENYNGPNPANKYGEFLGRCASKGGYRYA